MLYSNQKLPTTSGLSKITAPFKSSNWNQSIDISRPSSCDRTTDTEVDGKILERIADQAYHGCASDRKTKNRCWQKCAHRVWLLYIFRWRGTIWRRIEVLPSVLLKCKQDSKFIRSRFHYFKTKLPIISSTNNTKILQGQDEFMPNPGEGHNQGPFRRNHQCPKERLY
jgi:hypothetical protein